MKTSNPARGSGHLPDNIPGKFSPDPDSSSTVRTFRKNFPWTVCPAVASLGWVTPGAATEGVTPLFFLKTWRQFFCSSLSLSLSLFIAFTRVSPPPGCHPTPFLPVRPRFFTILCKFTHKNFFPSGVTPWRVSPGAVRPPVTPLMPRHLPLTIPRTFSPICVPAS